MFFLEGMFLHRMVYADHLKMLPHLVKDYCLTLRMTFLNIFGVTDDIGKLFFVSFLVNSSFSSLTLFAVLQKFFGEFLLRLDRAQGMDTRALESFFISVELRGQDNCLVLSHNGEGRSHAELLKEYGFEVKSPLPFFFLVSYINFLLFVQARTHARQFLADQAAHPEKSVLKLLEQYQHMLPGYYQAFLVAEEVTFLSFSEDQVISWSISPDNDVFGSYPVPVSDLVVGERVILKLKSSVRHQTMRLKRKVEQVLSRMAYPVEFVDNTTPTTHIQILRGKIASFKSPCFFIIS